MDLRIRFSQEIDKGFSKSDLEKLIGLPKNSLASFLSGDDKRLSRKNRIKSEKFLTDNQELNPFEIVLPKKEKIVIVDATKPQVIKPTEQPKTNFVLNTIKKVGEVHEPKEGSMAFFNKYGVMTKNELK